MSEQANALLLHIGPLRSESVSLIQQAGMPASVVSPVHSASQKAALPETVRVITAWVTAEGEDRTCYRYSLEDLDSLAEGTGLTDLYPGVTLEQRQTVETLAINDVVQEQSAAIGGISSLIIEQADQAMPLLKALKAKGVLASLNHLWVRTSTARLYEGMLVQQGLIEWCEEQGFEPLSTEAEDPEFALQGFKRNRLQGALRQAKQQANDFKKKLEAVTNERDELTKTLEASQKEVANQKQEREKLQSENQSLKQQNQQLADESSETQQKQRQLEIELERAEAQLELIKELLLKDKLLNNPTTN